MFVPRVSYDPIEKVWSGERVEPIFNPKQNVGRLILQVLRATPHKVTQVSHETNAEITCLEMYRRTIKMANFIQNGGLVQGDVVGFMACNSENLAPTLFACLALELPINPLAEVMVQSEIVDLWGKSRPKMVFCDTSLVNVVKSSIDELKLDTKICTFIQKVEGFQFVNEVVSESFDVEAFELPELVNPSSSIAEMMCSSGTTDSMKLICKTHEQIISILHPHCHKVHKIDEEAVSFSYTRIFWTTQLNFSVILGTLFGIKRIICTSPFDPDMLTEILDRHKVTMFLTNPPTFSKYLQSNPKKTFESVRSVKIVGSTAPQEVVEGIAKLFPNNRITVGYGCTEGGYLALKFDTKYDGSCGSAYFNVRMKVVDENGMSLGPNEIGEIYYQVPIFFVDYYGDSEKYRDAFEDGWAKSGDVGYINEKGSVFLLERKKFMLKYEAHFILPLELENLIKEVDGVQESCVVGVYDPTTGNDIIFAFVVKKEGRNDISEKDIEGYVNSRVNTMKKITGGVHFLNKLPVTATGKIKRTGLIDIAKEIFNKK